MMSFHTCLSMMDSLVKIWDVRSCACSTFRLSLQKNMVTDVCNGRQVLDASFNSKVVGVLCYFEMVRCEMSLIILLRTSYGGRECGVVFCLLYAFLPSVRRVVSYSEDGFFSDNADVDSFKEYYDLSINGGLGFNQSSLLSIVGSVDNGGLFDDDHHLFAPGCIGVMYDREMGPLSLKVAIQHKGWLGFTGAVHPRCFFSDLINVKGGHNAFDERSERLLSSIVAGMTWDGLTFSVQVLAKRCSFDDECKLLDGLSSLLGRLLLIEDVEVLVKFMTVLACTCQLFVEMTERVGNYGLQMFQVLGHILRDIIPCQGMVAYDDLFRIDRCLVVPTVGRYSTGLHQLRSWFLLKQSGWGVVWSVKFVTNHLKGMLEVDDDLVELWPYHVHCECILDNNVVVFRLVSQPVYQPSMNALQSTFSKGYSLLIQNRIMRRSLQVGYGDGILSRDVMLPVAGPFIANGQVITEIFTCAKKVDILEMLMAFDGVEGCLYDTNTCLLKESSNVTIFHGWRLVFVDWYLCFHLYDRMNLANCKLLSARIVGSLGVALFEMGVYAHASYRVLVDFDMGVTDGMGITVGMGRVPDEDDIDATFEYLARNEEAVMNLNVMTVYQGQDYQLQDSLDVVEHDLFGGLPCNSCRSEFAFGFKPCARGTKWLFNDGILKDLFIYLSLGIDYVLKLVWSGPFVWNLSIDC